MAPTVFMRLGVLALGAVALGNLLLLRSGAAWFVALGVGFAVGLAALAVAFAAVERRLRRMKPDP